MGNYLPFRLPLQRHNTGDVEDFHSFDATYRYPPIKSGSYFADHFVMAGEKFENMSQETFLFGENNDLNYLPSKPVNFPYPIANDGQPSRTIRCFVHLRKDSLKLVKEDIAGSEESSVYRIEFIFDTDLDCSIQIFMLATEEFTNANLIYTARNRSLVSEPVMYGKGAGQTFRSKNFLVKPTDFTPSELNYIPGGSSNATEIPLVVVLSVADGDFPGHCEATLAGVEALSNGLYAIKFLKQKIVVDGICLMTQEIYGIENKEKESQQNDDGGYDDDTDDNSECVVCMSEFRDTIMLPCRHLCLCNICAEQMRTKQSRCPICRANFHALLQIKAVREKKVATSETESPELEEIPLIQALNGTLDMEGNEATGLARSGSAQSRRSKRSSSRRRTSAKNRSAVTPLGDTNSVTKDDTERLGASDKRCDQEKPIKTNSKPEFHAVLVDKYDLLAPSDENPNNHVDASLPGTPMGSDSSAENVAMSVFLSSSASSQMISTRAQVTAPSSTKSKDRPQSAKSSFNRSFKHSIRPSTALGSERNTSNKHPASIRNHSTAVNQADDLIVECPLTPPFERPPTPTGFRSDFPEDTLLTDRSEGKKVVTTCPQVDDTSITVCDNTDGNVNDGDVSHGLLKRSSLIGRRREVPEDKI